MSALGHTLFDTAIGRCGVAWGCNGLTAAQLPEADDGTTRRRLLNSAGESEACSEWPSMVIHAVECVRAMLRGESTDLTTLPLDSSRLSPFRQAVYALAQAIPTGSIRTYGELARELGDVKLARAVGQALGSNPFAPLVPCHRILAVDQQLGGFSAHGGALTKRQMLTLEGAFFAPGSPGQTLPLFGEDR